MRALNFAYRKIFLDKTVGAQIGNEAVLADEKYGSNPQVLKLIDFIKSSERGCLR